MAAKINLLYMRKIEKYNQMAGAERVLFDLAVAFNKDKDFNLSVILDNCLLAEELVKNGVRVYTLPLRNYILFPYTYFKLAQIINTLFPHIVVSHHRYTTLMADLLPFRKYLLIHMMQADMFDKKFLSRFGDHVIAVSDGVKKNLVKFFKVREDKISVIYNGTKKPVPVKNQNLVLKELELDKDGKVIISCIARLSEQKGHIFLFKALSILPQYIQRKIKVLLIGNGELKDSLYNYARTLNLLDKVLFLGFRKDVPNILQITDFVALPSLWEGLSLCVIEAYMLGKPVIGTNVSGTCEVIKDNETGIIVPPGDPESLAKAMTLLVINESKRKKFGKKGKLFVEQHFSFEKMVEKHEFLYMSLLENKTSKWFKE